MVRFVRVTQEDIEQGVVGDPDRCPLALAAIRVLPQIAEAQVYPIEPGPPFDWVLCFVYLGGGAVPVILPPLARKWAMDYDAGIVGKPFEFEVEI